MKTQAPDTRGKATSSSPAEELERLLEKATPGKWEVVDLGGTTYEMVCARPVLGTACLCDIENRADFDLIAAARNHLPALLSLARRAEKMEEALRKIQEPITVAGPPDVVTACQDLHELICDIVSTALEEPLP